MSKVLMCDRCGNIFKAGEEGSVQGTVVLKGFYDDGSPHDVTVAQDQCPRCAADIRRPKVPQIAIGGLPDVVQ